MASFWGELRRRNVFRVGIAYLAAVWILIEVVDTLVPIINAPTWIPQVVVFSAALGFPLALMVAWFYEFTPEGVKASADVEELQPVSFLGRKLDFAIIGLLVLAVAFLLVRSPDDPPRVLANSVAVLPFENLSPDADDAYFSIGLHEEILTQLAKLNSLRVISRTSVLPYEDTDLSIPEIARELSVGAVMEGTVRYANEQVRITAQLIDADTDEHLWANTYQREFADIFEIESDIALNIADALEAEFSRAEQRNLEKRPTESPEAYAFYLRALATPWVSTAHPTAMQYLTEAIGFDSEFALAYGARAARQAAFLQFVGDRALADASADRARSDAEQALVLDQTIAQAHLALAVIAEGNTDWAQAEQAFRDAFLLSPNDPFLLNRYGRFKRNTGDYAEAIRLLEQLGELEPNAVNVQLGIAYRFARRLEEAAAAFQEALSIAPSNGLLHLHLGYTEIGRGNISEGLAEFQVARQLMEIAPFRVGQLALAYAQAGEAQEVSNLHNRLLELEIAGSVEGSVGDATWAMMYLALDQYELALERLEVAVENPTSGFASLVELKANPWVHPILEEDPRFVDLRERIGSSD